MDAEQDFTSSYDTRDHIKEPQLSDSYDPKLYIFVCVLLAFYMANKWQSARVLKKMMVDEQSPAVHVTYYYHPSSAIACCYVTVCTALYLLCFRTLLMELLRVYALFFILVQLFIVLHAFIIKFDLEETVNERTKDDKETSTAEMICVGLAMLAAVSLFLGMATFLTIEQLEYPLHTKLFTLLPCMFINEVLQGALFCISTTEFKCDFKLLKTVGYIFIQVMNFAVWLLAMYAPTIVEINRCFERWNNLFFPPHPSDHTEYFIYLVCFAISAVFINLLYFFYVARFVRPDDKKKAYEKSAKSTATSVVYAS